MKYLILLLVVACSGMSDGRYKKEFHLEDYKVAENPGATHSMLSQKMEKCYPQSDYPVYEKTVSEFNGEKNSGTIIHEIDNQSLGPQTLLMVEVLSDPSGSLVKVYSKGDLFRPAGVYKQHIRKWLDGKKVDCDARGKI